MGSIGSAPRIRWAQTLGLAALLLMPSGSSDAADKEGAKGPRLGTLAPLTKIQVEAALAKLQGSWKIRGYRLWDDGAYTEVALHKERIDETMETWQLRPDGTFRHILSESLFFTGRYELRRSVAISGGGGKSAKAKDPAHLVLRTYDVRSSIPGMKRKEDLFVATFPRGSDELLLYYLGMKLEAQQPLGQGHVFERKAPGTR